jgi:hypothetical protein
VLPISAGAAKRWLADLTMAGNARGGGRAAAQPVLGELTQDVREEGVSQLARIIGAFRRKMIQETDDADERSSAEEQEVQTAATVTTAQRMFAGLPSSPALFARLCFSAWQHDADEHLLPIRSC